MGKVNNLRPIKLTTLVYICFFGGLSAAEIPTNSIEKLHDAFQNQNDSASLFTPIGFSQKKSFAYFRGFNCSESGATFEGQLRIVDLVKDEVIFKKMYEDNFNEKEFRGILKENGIKIENLRMGKFPFKDNGVTYSIEISSAVEIDPENQYWHSEFELSLISSKHGKKLITAQSDDNPNSGAIESVMGFFKSPYEDRIVIVAVVLGGSLEGCTSRLMEVYGAHLTAGFKK